MENSFLVDALCAGLGIALFAGPLGCFVVWRRMAYFGETVAHSALLGVALGLLLNIHIVSGIIFTCLVTALLLCALEYNTRYSVDTLLGIMAHGALSLGVLIIAVMPSVRVDLNAYLFGDILAVSKTDIFGIYAAGFAVGSFLLWKWRALIRLTVHPEVALVDGIAVHKLTTALMITIALLVAASIKIVGILLITSLLIIPAATARNFAHTPTQMALYASIMALLSVVVGLTSAAHFDTPAGPSIVVTSLVFFIASLARRLR